MKTTIRYGIYSNTLGLWLTGYRKGKPHWAKGTSRARTVVDNYISEGYILTLPPALVTKYGITSEPVFTFSESSYEPIRP